MKTHQNKKERKTVRQIKLIGERAEKKVQRPTLDHAIYCVVWFTIQFLNERVYRME